MRNNYDIDYTEEQIELKIKFVAKLKENNKKMHYYDEIFSNYTKLYDKYISSRDLSEQSELKLSQISLAENNDLSQDLKEEIVKIQSELTKSRYKTKEAENNLNKNYERIQDLNSKIEFETQKTKTLQIETFKLDEENSNISTRLQELETLTHNLDLKIKDIFQENARLLIDNRKLNDNINILSTNKRLLTSKILSIQQEQAQKMNEYNDTFKKAQEKMKAADLFFNKGSQGQDNQKKVELSKMKIEEVKIPKTLKLKMKLHNKGITSIKFDAKGENFLTSGGDNYVKHWESSRNTEKGSFTGFTSAVTEACYDYSENYLFAGSMDKTSKLWGLKNNKMIGTFTGHMDYVNCVACYNSSLKGISGSSDRTIKEWDFQTQKLIRDFHCVSACHSLCISQDDSNIYSGHLDGVISIWSNNNKPENEIELHDDQILHMEMLKNENQMLTISKDNSIKLFDIRKLEAVYTVNEEELDQVCTSTISVSSDSKYFAVGSNKGFIYIINLQTGKVEDKISNRSTGSILSVAWKPFKSQLYIGDSNGYLSVWGVKEEK